VITGCYDLMLYCDVPDCNRGNYGGGSTPGQHAYGAGHGEFTAETGASCRKQAKKRGWKLNLRTGAAICPLCAKEGKKAPKQVTIRGSGPT